ncbi:unnamed protein product [Closterium sp. NIES-53]
MAKHIDVTTLTQDRLNELLRQLHESSEEITTRTAERTSLQNDVARAQQVQSQAPGTPGQPAPQASQHGSVGQPASTASDGVVRHDGDDDHDTTHPEVTNAARSQPCVTISAPTNDTALPSPMPLKPQRPPCFDPSQRGGHTVQAWLFTLNVFFYANYDSDDTAKIRYAMLLLRGPAMDWWRVIVTKPMDYATLPTREGQTGPWAPSYFIEKLRTWRQLGSVQDYTSGFLALCEQVGYMHESERIDRYIGGLKHDIVQEIQLRGITDFQEILAMAEKLDFFCRPRPGSYGSNSNWGHRSRGANEGATIRAVAANATATPFKGRCFACNRPGHRTSECPENAKGKGEAEQQKQTKQQGNAGNGGASHSLINTATARKLRLPLDRCLPEIDSRLVDGTPLAIRERVDRVRIRCGGNLMFSEEMLATTLDGTDILLDRNWLQRHNPLIDWTTGDCTVRVNGNNIALPRWGSPESSSVRVNAITMKRAIVEGADVYAFDIREAEAADKGGDLQKLLADVPDDLAALLKQYSGIFPDDLPTGLPPQRPHDHMIELEPGA